MFFIVLLFRKNNYLKEPRVNILMVIKHFNCALSTKNVIVSVVQYGHFKAKN